MTLRHVEVETPGSHRASTTEPGFSGVYRTAGVRAKVTIGLLALTGAISFITAIVDLGGFDILRQAEAGTLTDADALSYDSTVQVLAFLYLVAFPATAIAFLAWLSRSVDNVPPLTGERPMVTPRWSIGWWFVPFANLVKPYQIVKDLLVRMPASATGGTGIALAWWLTWVGTGIIGWVSLRLSEGGTLDELRTYFTANVVLDALTVIAAALAIIIVRRIQAAADLRAVAAAALIASPSLDSLSALPPCPRCGTPRVAGMQFCGSCGLDLWAAYDQAAASEAHQA